MHGKFIIANIVLALVLATGHVLAETTNPWNQLNWVDVQGAVPAEDGYNFKPGDIPELDLDIVGDVGRWPGHYAVCEKYLYFEVRIIGAATAGRWTAVFFPEGVEDPEPRNHFNMANLLVGLEKDSKGEVRVFIVKKGNGQSHNLGT